MSGLMLHAGAAHATRAEVANVRTPEATDNWTPIPHLRLIDLAVDALSLSGLTVVREELALWRDGLRFFGLLELRNGAEADDYALMLGLRNAHDQSFAASGALGSRVFVCDNLAFSAQIVFARKHTRFIERDLPTIVERTVARLVESKVAQAERIDAYKRFEIGEATAHDILVRAIDSRVLPVTKLPATLQEWRKPRYPDFEPRTAWSLFNACTETLKGSLAQLPSRTQALHGLMDQVVGLVSARDAVLDGIEDAEVVGIE